MQFELLTNRPDAIPIIGRWYNQEWGRRLHNETEEQSIEKLNEYLNTDQIPFILVATEGVEVIGAAQLKYHEMADIFPEKEHWLGGVFVAPEYRGNGLGSRLAEEIARHASLHGVRTLHLQTEQLDGGLYRKLGWQPVQRVDNHGMHVLVMERQVGA
ncbi:MAG: GNAT family N-acetyltransferase [Pseudomonadota bacterium]